METTTYSFKKGLGKCLKFVLTGLIAVVTVTGFSEVSIWSLLEQYLKPIISTLTVGGVFAWLLNYTKIKFGSRLGGKTRI